MKKTIKPEPAELIAEAVQKIADGMKRLNDSRLNRKAIVILLAHSTGLPMRDIGLVLDSLKDLAKDYLKP